MKDGNECDLLRARSLLWNMIPCQRSTYLLVGEAVNAFAYLGKVTYVVVGQFAVQYEVAQGIALPSRPVLGPFENLFENIYGLTTKSMSAGSPFHWL